MTAMTEYPPGTPSWVDLGSPDVDASVEIYGGLFGREAPGPPEAGGYRIFHLRGRTVAGVGPLLSPQQPPGVVDVRQRGGRRRHHQDGRRHRRHGAHGADGLAQPPT